MTGERFPTPSLCTVRKFVQLGTCSETLFNVANRAYGVPAEPEEHASAPLGGGIVSAGHTCGQLWGASLAAGAQAHRLFGPGPQAEAAAVLASQRLVVVFTGRYAETTCRGLTNADFRRFWSGMGYLARGGIFRCTRMAVQFGPLAVETIDEVYAGALPEAPPGCASCAARTARALGASDLHATMAAGFAGGVGLHGGACGALGTAVWLTAMDHPGDKIGVRADGTHVGALIDRFLEHTGGEYTCAALVGRRFDGVIDHARHLSAGGCARIIETLAAPEERGTTEAA